MKKAPLVSLTVSLLLLLIISPLTTSAQDGFQKFSTDDGLVTFQYPTEWFAEADEKGNINIANSEAVLDAVQEKGFVPAEGDILLSLLFFPTAYADALGIQGQTLEDKITGLRDTMVEFNQDLGPERVVTAGDVILSEEVGEATIAQVSYTQGTTTEGMLAIWQTPQDFIGVAILLASPGNAANQEETLHTILRSVEFSQTFAEILEQYKNQ
ncbi:MAG: hypothetical protein HY862_06925 [Chloroflexi bacterium]|nr:hypothetical protein [Chloroflexota bacterium]